MYILFHPHVVLTQPKQKINESVEQEEKREN
jgi:hypothetical protein